MGSPQEDAIENWSDFDFMKEGSAANGYFLHVLGVVGKELDRREVAGENIGGKNYVVGGHRRKGRGIYGFKGWQGIGRI